MGFAGGLKKFQWAYGEGEWGSISLSNALGSRGNLGGREDPRSQRDCTALRRAGIFRGQQRSFQPLCTDLGVCAIAPPYL